MMTLVTGGAKCGKSHYAEKMFENYSGRKFYIATMQPYGDEALSAIERHRKIRAGKGFETIEKYTDIEETNLPKNCGILLECTANLCANEMFRNGEIYDPTEKIILGFEHLKSCSEMLVIVTNEVGSDGISYEKSTAEYIKIMGKINAKAAETSDNVIECVYGIPVALKGRII
ncbi:MAG: bifunctional adenosylcobinamide kinase/adenosylcobinamide-phosphate guanylyltransferase [Oscillospiraceae bacterium]|nr:bifunctional adenosylcobinamide kinase/adenosylcobinamide-phosphate guanylyltransferase [Oscillospiraceae bacterium]